ncbi:replication factor C large subunit, putative [Entamoeba invadens IP1]|uniref:Replication factor C subunit 1 n=1 Tax=Entamoeba invadens IP1 TaxID=370355 RepID=A0A0A1UG77_ENTIV|nr:replication factor C large subunit, putative [Entamoeba invadens IP1]ELP94590.1 replication factor C large subunit, putative [Entamoeba invadens IP1]|eukprot:XP_004261361.1 replication factor C large subunit, putative [Entamoeba invadens IP1]
MDKWVIRKGGPAKDGAKTLSEDTKAKTKKDETKDQKNKKNVKDEKQVKPSSEKEFKTPSRKTSKKKVKKVSKVKNEKEIENDKTNEHLSDENSEETSSDGDSIKSTKPKKSSKTKSTLVIVKTTTPIQQVKKVKPKAVKTTHFTPFSHDTTAKNKGSKFVPKGKGTFFGEDEFERKNFVLTGVYEELDRDEMKNFIQDFGGNVATSISGKTHVIVAGDDAGPSKLAKAQEKGLLVWSEDDVLNYAIKKLGITDTTIKSTSGTTENGGKDKGEVKILSVNNDNDIWTEKYRPQTIEDLVGNKTQVMKFKKWLESWKNVIPDRQAVLLAGSPGVGKTTTAKILARVMGYNAVEFNASDVRNKKSVSAELKKVLLNGQISRGETYKPALVIMDEVDGMSSGDRGGIAELVQFIKKTTSPIVCICNDVMDKKMQSLVNVCETINFVKITPNDLETRLSVILKNENIEVASEKIEEIAKKSHGDVRYAINVLQTFCKCGMSIGEKNEDVDYIEIIPTLITQYWKTSFNEKINLFFMDTFMVPFYLHDSLWRGQQLSHLGKALQSFCLGDIFQNCVMKTQNWKLMPTSGLFKLGITTFYGQTKNGAMKVMFPKTLGKVSKRKGNQTRVNLVTSKLPGRFLTNRSFAARPMMYIRNTIMRVMETDPKKAALIAQHFGIEKLVWDELVKIGTSLEKTELFKEVSTGKKAQFTRELKVLTTGIVSKGKKGKNTKNEDDDLGNPDIDLGEMSEDDYDYQDDAPEYIPDDEIF